MSLSTINQSQVTPQTIYNVVSAATSQNPAEMQAASSRLQELLDVPGTFNALQEIAAQNSYPLYVRQLSIIQLKNSAAGHWRSRKYAIHL